MLRYLFPLGCLLSAGCSLLPDISHQPTLHNPFPQLSKVAVAPFFNLSDEPTLNGEQVAMAYFLELQSVPGFEVVPVNVVQRAIQDNDMQLGGPEDARRLAQLLDVDAVVIGAVTDYSPWYPPRFGLQAEWYAANPCFHPIPPGYGLPWGTPEEKDIPAPLVREAEFAVAKAQLKTQTPPYEKLPQDPPAKPIDTAAGGRQPASEPGEEAPQWQPPQQGQPVEPLGHETPVDEAYAAAEPVARPPGMPGAELPPDWPDPRGFIPPGPRVRPPTCWPSDVPVIRHTRVYNGNDMEFTEALANYCYFRDDARFGGWQGYLQRSDDLVRFCCHLHIAETLTARGGAGETRVVWRWPTIR